MIANPPRLPLSSAHVDRHGAYLMDTGTHMYLWIGAAVSDQFCMQVLDCSSYQSMPETMVLQLLSFLFTFCTFSGQCEIEQISCSLYVIRCKCIPVTVD